MKKFVIIDLSKDINLAVNDSLVFQLSYGATKLNNSQILKKNLFSEVKFKKFRILLNNLLLSFYNKINDDKSKINLPMLEFFNYSTHLYEYYEYLHRKDKILQFHKRFHPKNLAYTELGFHLREKLGNCNWHTNSFHTYPTMTSIDFANQRSFLAQQKDRRYWFLKEIFNYSNEQTDYLIKKFRTNEKLNYNGFSYINLYSFETDVARYDL